jgi:tRNA (mo5U34)-methyltransferase
VTASIENSNLVEDQKRVDLVRWYHDFDFPGGARARAGGSDVEWRRRSWSFTKSQLDRVDFLNKTVIEIGCWDGYWSFYAENRGAKHVLATDDKTQNPSASAGLNVAKDLLRSNVETRDDVSIYRVSEIQSKFDLIVCLGVYYHLIDPLYAFAQIRHCCHADTVVLLEGDLSYWPHPNSAYFDFSDVMKPVFVPTQYVLNQFLAAAYLEVFDQTYMKGDQPHSFKSYLRKAIGIAFAIGTSVASLPGTLPRPRDRVFTMCRPFTGNNKLHHFRPPFDLDKYDDRFRSPDSPTSS